MNKVLSGKTAIVTGAGKEKGMGRATALKLAELGANVVVTDIAKVRKELNNDNIGLTVGEDFSYLEKVVKEIEALGSKGLAIAVDVTDKAQIIDCVEKAVETFGGIDILFNNAGVAIGVGPFLEMDDSKWELSWDVNVMGIMNFSKVVLPYMIEQKDGVIINNVSTAGLGSLAEMSAYCTTKHAAIGLTKSIAAEFGQYNIRCNATCPGMIKTDMGEAEIQLIGGIHGISETEAENAAAEEVAMKRWGKPEEVANVVGFLTTPAAQYVNGIAIPVAGGLPTAL